MIIMYRIAYYNSCAKVKLITTQAKQITFILQNGEAITNYNSRIIFAIALK